MSAAASAALVLVVAVEYVADADPLVTELGEIARGRLDRGVPETGLDLLDRHALAGQRRGVVAAQRVGMGEALGHAGDGGVAAHDLRETLLGDRTGHAVSRAREADEQHIVVPQAAAAALGMRAQPCLERGESRGGDRDLALDVALATNEELVLGAVGTWPADRPRGQAAQLGVAQPAVTQQPQKRV